MHNYKVSFANRLSACDNVFSFNVFYSLTCNVQCALQVIFFFLSFSVVYFFFFLFVFVSVVVCFLCMDPSGLIQNKRINE